MLEIMIVLGAIGLLSLIAIPSYKKARDRSRAETAKGELQLIAAAVRQLTWDTGKWPSGKPLATPGSAETWDLVPNSAGLLGATATFTSAGWRGPYLRKITKDPWGNPYFFDPDFRISGTDRIVVGSFGPNGVGRNLYDSDDIYVLLR